MHLSANDDQTALRRYREASRIETYRALHEILSFFLEELDRDDGAHAARMMQRDDDVRTAVRLAHEAWTKRDDLPNEGELRKAFKWAEQNPVSEL